MLAGSGVEGGVAYVSLFHYVLSYLTLGFNSGLGLSVICVGCPGREGAKGFVD